MVERAQGPGLTIAIPALDEADYIRSCLVTLLAQVDEAETEILVLDGGSADRTREIVAEVAARHPCVSLVDNPGRFQSAALNLAAAIASPRSRILLRADAHARYPDGFVRACIDALSREGANSVVVSMRAAGSGCFQRAVAAAQNSFVGNGGAAHRTGRRSGPVDHGHHAAFDLSSFRALNGYDPSFSHNEDAEYDLRLRRAGGRIVLTGETHVEYFPRSTVVGLWRQYRNHGRGRARTVRKHRLRPALRQLLPPAAVGGSIAGLLLSPVHPAFLAVPAGYLLILQVAAVAAAARTRDACVLAMGFAAMVMHAAWSAGFVAGLGEPRPAERLRPAPPAEAPVVPVSEEPRASLAVPVREARSHP